MLCTLAVVGFLAAAYVSQLIANFETFCCVNNELLCYWCW